MSAFLSELPQAAQSQIVSVQVQGPRENADAVKEALGSWVEGREEAEEDEQAACPSCGDVRQLSGAWMQVRQRRL